MRNSKSTKHKRVRIITTISNPPITGRISSKNYYEVTDKNSSTYETGNAKKKKKDNNIAHLSEQQILIFGGILLPIFISNN